MKQIYEWQLAIYRDFRHFARVQFQILVLFFAIGKVWPLQIFKRHRRTQHKLRSGFFVVLLSQRVINKRFQIFAKLRQTRFAGVRFVVAKKRDDNVGLDLAQPLIGRAKVFRPRSFGQCVAAKPQIPHDEIVLRKAIVQHGFQMSEMLQAIGERIADDGDVIALLQFQLQLLGRRGGFRKKDQRAQQHNSANRTQHEPHS